MFRSLCFTLFIAQAAFGFEIVPNQPQEIVLTKEDTVPTGKTKLLADTLAAGFVGDLIIGARRADETIFTRLIEANNPADVVQGTSLNLNIQNGYIHHISLINQAGSYGVGCDGCGSLGGSVATLNIRVPPYSKATMLLVVAAH